MPFAHHRHGNPENLPDYVAKMEDPSRADWQKPDEILKALRLSPGQVVAEIGPGPGYFALRIARIVGDAGQVIAVDVEPEMLRVLRDRVASAGQRNITPVFALPDDPLIQEGTCDLIFIANTYHHFPEGPAYLKTLARKLKPAGRIANVDFHKTDLPVGPPVAHKISRDEFLRDAESAGLQLAAEHSFLPYQYFVVLSPKARKRRAASSQRRKR
jgi:ubiquinone/menaquinone biosynthesis C-methylase UbiE